MAITTKEEQKSMISFADPGNEMLPEPAAGGFLEEDKAMMLNLFYEAIISVVSPIDFVVNFCLQALNPNFNLEAEENVNFILGWSDPDEC